MTDNTRDTFNTGAKKRILLSTYDDSDDALQKRMDGLMGGIDKNPASYGAVEDYGFGPLGALKRIDAEMWEVENRVAELRRGYTNATAKMRDTVAKTYQGAKAPLSYGQAYFTETLDTRMAIEGDLLALDRDYREVMERLGRLDGERSDATRDLKLYNAAAPEVLRRYDEKYTLLAARQYKLSGNPDDEDYLHDVRLRRDEFAKRGQELSEQVTAGIAMGQRIRALIDGLYDLREETVQYVTKDGAEDWRKAMKQAADAARKKPAAPFAP